jgi:hypothetical protein
MNRTIGTDLKKYQSEKIFLDLSGFMFSGKHAVIELVREFEGFYVPHFEFEFPLIRVQDGISDLENALVTDWSPVRCPAAIRRFRRLVDICDRKATRTRLGYDFETRYSGRFRALADELVSSLIDVEWDAWWPYAWHDYSACELIGEKIKARLGRNGAFESRLALGSGDHFIEKVRGFLEPLLAAGAPPNCKTIVMHNALEPFNPMKGLNYFNDGRAINVYRDPRDNYVASVRHSPLFRSVAGADSVETYIKRYRLLRQLAARAKVDPAKVLNIQYESLIRDYDATVENIRGFLDVDRSQHKKKRVHFNPSESAKFVDMWRTFEDQSAIERIERELSEYCV